MLTDPMNGRSRFIRYRYQTDVFLSSAAFLQREQGNVLFFAVKKRITEKADRRI